MTHALKLGLHTESSFDEFFASYIDSWEEISSEEFHRMRKGAESFLREYGKTNKDEFFSVCVEHFFEAPEDFRTSLPDIYYHLCVLLNQNPLNEKNDYKIDEGFYSEVKSLKVPVPKNITKNYRYSAWHWTLTILFVGATMGTMVLFYFSSVTVLPDFSLVFFPLILGLIPLPRWKKFKENQALSFNQYVLYSVFGFGVCVLSMVLLINFFTSEFSAKTERFKVVDMETVFSTTKYGREKIDGYNLHLENNEYDYCSGVRFLNPGFTPRVDSLEITTAYGIFGIPVLKGRRFIAN